LPEPRRQDILVYYFYQNFISPQQNAARLRASGWLGDLFILQRQRRNKLQQHLSEIAHKFAAFCI
jgi:hypothetical protein